MSSPQQEPLRDSKSSLYEAALAVVKARDESQAERIREATRVAPRGRTRLILLLIGAAAAALLAWRPVWLAGPDSIPSEPPGIAAASLRLALVRERERVNDFVQRNGRLPATLREAGSLRADFLLQAGDSPGVFTLSGQAGDSSVVLSSTEAADLFLGNSLIRIRARTVAGVGGGQ
jgi:hypothetical protein